MFKKMLSYGIILVLLIIITAMYNEQLASIPLLILSAYLFFLGTRQMLHSKKRKM
ncbi:MAG TPA: hypothetical protein K8V30_09135 [Metalysinibacillus jejuensis]|uniref:Uncharacterized protein n=1 Tax=Metalysinibacillus jejuensis TaxID=914327 RepID=A0A921NCE9_9BACL|nr:hypothetical protein [Metalysinibacillus jejuensis]HJH11830.1 hypothetical protein [Metalysinibacillus jejuensis]